MAKTSKVAPPEVVGRRYAAKTRTGRFPTGLPEFGFEYTTPKPYCEVKRLKEGRCATQLNFINGKTVLRLCGEYGQPGRVVPVSSPEDASAKAAKFCKTKVGRKVRASKPELVPEVVPEAAHENLGDHDTEDDTGSGDVTWMANAARESLQQRSDEVLSGWPKPPSRRQQQRPARSSGRTALWLMGGTAMGLIALKLLNKGESHV